MGARDVYAPAVEPHPRLVIGPLAHIFTTQQQQMQQMQPALYHTNGNGNGGLHPGNGNGGRKPGDDKGRKGKRKKRGKRHDSGLPNPTG